jgi:GTPase SAR1 family protein
MAFISQIHFIAVLYFVSFFRSHSMYLDNRRSGSLQRRRLPATPDQIPTTNRSNGFENEQLPAGFYSSRLHRKVYEIRSAELRHTTTSPSDWSSRSTPIGSPKKQRSTRINSNNNNNNMWQYSPARSQSFRHRSRPPIEIRRNVLEDVSQERRRSTPTVTRRCSLQRTRYEAPRTDVWPEPKQMSEIEERFLRLPDSEDYTRVRQFNIDKKGAVVSRGDSFRRKKNKDNSPSPFPQSENESPRETASRSTSISSAAGSGLKVSSSAERSSPGEDEAPSTSQHYKICILGQSGAGKSALISQFITSEYRNAFADEVEVCDNTVSVAIGGAECELIFIEFDPNTTDEWKNEEVQAYVLMYSIDSKSSFRTITNVMEDLRIDRNNIPIILAGNKVDLERKRAIAATEVRTISHQYGVAHFEISVALNHEINELLVGIVAEIKNAFSSSPLRFEQENSPTTSRPESLKEASQDFQAAIRRFSQRKKRQMGVATVETDTGKCANLSPQGLFAKLRQWRRGTKC